MNNECLKLKDHSSGFQMDEEIQSIVMQAIGTNHVQEEDYCDDVMVVTPPPPPPPGLATLDWNESRSEDDINAAMVAPAP